MLTRRSSLAGVAASSAAIRAVPTAQRERNCRCSFGTRGRSSRASQFRATTPSDEPGNPRHREVDREVDREADDEQREEVIIAQEVLQVLDGARQLRSEEHTSELQSRPHLVCRLLLEKKKQQRNKHR